jgi:hypothetical protein
VLVLVSKGKGPPNGLRGLARVIVYDPDHVEGLTVARRLNGAMVDLTVTVVSAPATHPPRANDPVDVGLINLAGGPLDGLAFGAELKALAPWIEIAFWFDERNGGPAAAAAARSLGIVRLIPLGSLAIWLETALGPLVRMARARREHAIAEKALPPLSGDRGGDCTMALPEAERRFRETYLRRILSESANHRAAAERAGLPYTTLCSMLKKLNLR